MKINPFEGARRITRFVQALWVLIVGAFVVIDAPNATATYHTTGPGRPFLLSPDGFSCGYYEDATEYVYRTTPAGTDVRVTLCFQAASFSDGRRLVPYMLGSDGQSWGNTTYSSEVSAYTEQRAGQFTLPEADGPELDQRWWNAQFGHWKTGAIVAAGGCVVLWFFSTIVGWIVRGFMSIPMGQDTRP
jgi:hypothetical protein